MQGEGQILISQEAQEHYKDVESITEIAFKDMEHADGDEHIFITKLRKSECFVPELSLVAIISGQIVGNIMFSTSKIVVDEFVIFPTLTLSIVSVHPDFQRKGVGKQLVHKGLKLAKEMNFTSVNVVGHPSYYPKFGFAPSSRAIISPFHLSDPDAFMFLELEKDVLKGIQGKIEYAKEFFD